MHYKTPASLRQMRQIQNNIGNFTAIAGVDSASLDSDDLLFAWGRQAGSRQVQELLRPLGLEKPDLVDHLKKIDLAEETTHVRIDGCWVQAGVLQREGGAGGPLVPPQAGRRVAFG